MRALLLVLVLAVPALALGQTPATADDIVARVHARYGATEGMRAPFRQHYWSSATRRAMRSTTGELAVTRPDLFRFDYASGLIVVSDGALVTQFEPGDDGGPGQFFRTDAGAFTSIASILTGADLSTDYRASIPTRLYGDPPPEGCDVVELRPRAAGPHVRRIWVYVSHVAATEGVIQRVSVEDPDGNWNHFELATPTFAPVDASTYRFTPPAGARELHPS